jgi:hypothetical protein
MFLPSRNEVTAHWETATGRCAAMTAGPNVQMETRWAQIEPLWGQIETLWAQIETLWAQIERL